MQHKIFSIFDQKANAYLTPFFLPEKGMAIRTFSDCINSKDHAFGRHPSDYTIFEIGSYNDADGQITSHLAPLVLHNGLELVAHQDELPLFKGNSANAQTDEVSNDPPIQPGANG